MKGLLVHFPKILRCMSLGLCLLDCTLCQGKRQTYTCYLYWFLTHVAPFLELKWTLFEAYIGCDTFENALFTECLWAHDQHLTSVIFKRAWPYCQPLSIIIDTCVFPLFPPTSIHSCITPSVLPFALILFPFSSLPCHSLLFSVTQTWWQSLIPLFHWEKGKAQSAARWERRFSVCAHSFTFNHPQWQWPSFPIFSVTGLTAQG